jgi:DNA-binding SARP family transcriptional activator
MEFSVLGPVEVRVAGQPVTAGHARQRAVLAVLLLELGHVVPAELLIDRVWGEDPPAAVRNVLYGNIARLKSVLARAADPAVSLARQPGGYRLQADPELVDLYRFRALVAEAARAAGDDARGARSLRTALGLWHGPALAGLASPWLAAMAHSLEMERDAAALELTDIRLRLGEHGALAAELAGQAADRPGDERLAAQLMLALYRDGRQAEALAAYQHARQILVEELGAEPGPALKRLHGQILAADPALSLPGPAAPRAAEPEPARPPAGGDSQGRAEGLAPVVPRQLPAAVADFTGRAAELTALTRILDQASAESPGTVVISAIGGTAGVGKTTLALHWAHQVAGRFCGGQLYVNLRGFDPSGIPMSATEAVRGFLDALGLPPDRIPAQPDARAGLYRSLLADRAMLIMLDNARDEQQVRPLLPASPASLVVVTSRNQLGGLAVADRARLLALDVLSHDEAVDLLTARIGAARAAAEPAAVGEIAALCGRLPLALAVAAARAEARPGFPLAALAAELKNRAGRLDALDAGEAGSSVRAVFSWSYRQLSGAAARMYRLLGLHPGPDISAPAAASLAGVDEPAARRLLAELARAHLAAEHVPGRYALHDLLRAYAADQARDTDSQPESVSAIGRVLDHYLHTARNAAIMMLDSHRSIQLTPPSPGTTAERFTGHEQALAWFEAEHHVLLAAMALAVDSGLDNYIFQMGFLMLPIVATRGRDFEWTAIKRMSMAVGVRDDEAMVASGARDHTGTLGDYQWTPEYYANMAKLYQRLGNRRAQAVCLYSLAAVAEYQGQYAEALGHAERSASLFHGIEDRAGEAELLNAVGWYHALLGNYQQARAACRQALALNAEYGSSHLEGNICNSLGYAEYHAGDFAEAAACYERALSIFRAVGDRWGEADTLTNLGDIHRAVGEPLAARQAWQQALAILEDLQHPDAAKIRAKLACTDPSPRGTVPS